MEISTVSVTGGGGKGGEGRSFIVL